MTRKKYNAKINKLKAWFHDRPKPEPSKESTAEGELAAMKVIVEKISPDLMNRQSLTLT